MSFILDALKKSENERQRHQGPSLVDVPTRRATSDRPWWVMGLAALLVLNLIVFAVVLLRKTDERSADAQSPVTNTTATAPVPMNAAPPRPEPLAAVPPRAPSTPIPQPASGDPTVRSLADEAGVPESEDGAEPIEPDLADAADVPAGPPIVSSIRGPNSEPARTQSPPSNGRASSGGADENLPTINDLTVSGSSQFPPIHLDIHVYATAAADRFVFINMKKYREGDRTSDGLFVERIRRDDVILNHKGMRFVLPRQ